jgi:hypothetical protein
MRGTLSSEAPVQRQNWAPPGEVRCDSLCPGGEMKRQKSRACSIHCVSAAISILSVLFMPQWVLAEDDASANDAALYRMAADTWKFYAADIDPKTFRWTTLPGRVGVR